MQYSVNKTEKTIHGVINLNGSKSISNRALIIRALCNEDFEIEYLSNSKDTTTLLQLLSSNDNTLDTGAAGTTFRFMTAYLALQEGEQVLTGSERMKQRPIGVLVDALQQIGGQIEYLEKDGYPPLKIKSPKLNDNNRIAISANVSSQYISALLMIGPTLPDGIELELATNIVSRPYIEMTLNLMAYFGIKYTWKDQIIRVPAQKYIARPFKVEADWSAASYYYGLAAIAEEVDIQLNGIWEDSVQGDAVLSEMMNAFSVKSTFNATGVHLSKSDFSTQLFEWDFIRCPDIAQTLAVVCAATGIPGVFTGLETLRIKETDRIEALTTELKKVDVDFSFHQQVEEKEYFKVSGSARVDNPIFDTYEDHRMAMAFAPLGLLGKVNFKEPMVVVKSYPAFWDDWKKLGFSVKELV